MKRSHRVRAPAALVALLFGSSALAGPTTITYQYDPLGQLIGSSQDGSARATYSYDSAGNRVCVQTFGNVNPNNTLTVPAGTTTTISTVQTYTGKTMVSGELDVASGGSIASSQQASLKASGAVFDVSGAGVGGATVTVQELSGIAGSTIRLGACALSLTETTAANYAGAITDGGVAGGTGGGLVVNGSAPLTLTGADSFTGKTQIYGQLDLAGSAVLNQSKAVTLKASGALRHFGRDGEGGDPEPGRGGGQPHLPRRELAEDQR